MKYATTTYYETKIQQLEEAIKRVRELHVEGPGPADDILCKHCCLDEYSYYEYPCPTIQALEGTGEVR